MATPKRLMNAKQASTFLGVHYNTLHNWNQMGMGPPRTLKGKRWYYVLDVLKDWLSLNAPAVAATSFHRAASAPQRSQSPSSASAFQR